MVWRIMDNYKKFVKEKQFKDEFTNNTTMSQSARLDWSNDGMIISSTSGFISGMYTSPLISRTNWKIEGHLKGHEKSVNISRFNPMLKKEVVRGKLASSSYLATSGGDSCITIWKTGDESPFFIIRQAFHSGVNDLSWGMEGNLLFGCSNDGEIMVCHF